MSQGQARTQFVGREPELRELLEALDEARDGRGRTVLVGGDPGIGKSRLADELAARADALGATVLWGRGWEDAGAPAYWPWVQVLRTLLRSLPRQRLREHLGLGAADVAQMLPELRVLFPDLPVPIGQQSESARFQLFDSTTSLLRSAAAEHPMLIVLDDLHAADTPSILLLRFLAGQLSDMPVLVAGTYRDLELTPDHPLTLAIAEMARERATRLIMLGGLRSDAVSDYIRATTNIQPDELTVAAVWRETNGNPLFVGEAVRLLEAEGRLDDVGDLSSLRVAVPAGVRAVIGRRVGHLGDNAARLLSIGAVIGPEFGTEILRRVAGLQPAEVAEAIDEAVQAGLLVPVSGMPARYRFSHDLVRETLYDQLPPSERGVLHGRIAGALEAAYPLAVEAHLAELAFHYFEAAQSAIHDTEVANDARGKGLAYARRAGEQAAGSLAFEQASESYGMALRMLGDETDDNTRAELLIALGDADARTGDLDKARVSFLEASRLARRLGSGALLARAALGFGGRHQWARAGNDTILVPLLQDALEVLGTGDDGLRVRLLTRLAGALRSEPSRRADSARLSEEAVELARRIDDQSSLGYALAGRFWATWWPENPEERADLAREIVAVAASIGDGERIAEAQLMRFLSLFERGRLDDAREQMERLGQVLRETRQQAHVWLEPTNRAEIALFDGDFELAERLVADEGKRAYRVTPGRDDVSAAGMHRFILRRDRGGLSEEEANVRASVRDFPWYPMHKAALCCLLIELGREGEARVVFNELAANDFEPIYRDNEWLFGMSLASQACAQLGDAAAAAILYEQLAPYAGRHAVGHAEGSIGAIDTYLGLLAATLSRLDDAARHLEAAIEFLRAQGGRPWHVRAQWELSRVLTRRAGPGDADRATALAAAALDGARQLGMVLADEIAAVAGSAGDGSGANDAASTVETHTAAAGNADTARFHREGDYWAVEFGRDSFTVRDSKGMHHLARLLGNPGIELHALDVVVSPHGAGQALTREDGLVSGDPSDAGPILDAQAKAAYRERLEQIREDLAEAERWNDGERAARLDAEKDALARELAAAIGLGRRDRPSSSSSERARVSATRAIRAAMERINEYSPAFGAHLGATIRTGTYCSYTPDPRAPISWRF